MLEEQTEQDDSISAVPITPPWSSYRTTNNNPTTNNTEQEITSNEEETTSSEEPTTDSEERTSYDYDDTSSFETETGPTATESETMSFTTYSGIMSLPTDPGNVLWQVLHWCRVVH